LRALANTATDEDRMKDLLKFCLVFIPSQAVQSRAILIEQPKPYAAQLRSNRQVHTGVDQRGSQVQERFQQS
jgi:hypothetical protein